ncbi:hypothetical protein HRbin36_02567 [bacterium HR36]|nr:hypothetical protein HRbin36_02567 [bacterium HR36]
MSDRPPAKFEDDISRLQAGTRRRTIWFHAFDYHPPAGRSVGIADIHAIAQTQPRLDIWRSQTGKQIASYAQHLIDGQSEGDSLRPCANGHVYSYQFPLDIEKRAPRIARVDAGIGLDKVLVHDVSVERHVAAQSANDTDGDTVLIAVSVANGNDGFTKHEVSGGANGDSGQRSADVNPEQGQIVVAVTGHQLGGIAGAIHQNHADIAHIFDDVIIGENVAARIQDNASPHTTGARKRLAKFLCGGAANGTLALNANYGGTRSFDRFDNCRTPGCCSCPNRRQSAYAYHSAKQPSRWLPFHGACILGSWLGVALGSPSDLGNRLCKLKAKDAQRESS